jgi:NTE family protein
MRHLLLVFFLLFIITTTTAAQSVGLVLSGGGARGLAHIGAIRALEEQNIPIDFIAGTSAGAVIGCLYAMGYSPTEMDSIVRTKEFESWATGKLDPDFNYYFTKQEENASWISLRFSLDSLFGTPLPTNLVSSVPYDYALMRGTSSIIARANYNFDSLFIPFRCVASDITQKKSYVFRNGDLARAVRASSAYPFYFRPITIDGKIFYDGGLYDNFPSDVMMQEFKPGYIIGINAAGDDRATQETDLLSLLQAMMTVPTNLSMFTDKGILIDLETENFDLFDFGNPKAIIEEGYTKTLGMMDSIKTAVSERSSPEQLKARRFKFRSGIKPIQISKLDIEGISDKQASYIRSIVKPDSAVVSLDQLRSPYFRFIADKNIRSVDPQLTYQPDDGYFNLKLKVTRERDLTTQFGGNISSRPISEAYAGITYLLWGKRSYSFSSNFYFGKLYTSGQAQIRMEAPTKLPYYIELDATLNQYDYFRSSNAFFAEQKPAYILKSDYNFGVNAGIPSGNKAKVYGSAAYIRLADNYYQSQNFLQADTADKTTLKGYTGQLSYEWNTLNKKQFANEGAFLQLRGRVSSLAEKTIPGSTSVNRSIERAEHLWFQASLRYDNYFLKSKHFKIGYGIHAVISNMPFLNNYTVSVVNSPSYEPILEMRTLFLPEFHAHSFAGFGSKNVISVRSNIDVRLEGYVFQPYQELLKTADNKVEYGKPFDRRYYLASGGVVFHSPIGPLSLHLNYYDQRKNPVSVLFTAGFLLFNPSALD